MKRILVSCFGLGHLPIAPGTWGSLPPAVIFALLGCLGASVLAISIVMAVLAIAASIICVAFSPASIAATGKKDPGEVVTDEVAGQAVTFIILSRAGADSFWLVALLGFLAFRIFDIVKPWPIRHLEKLPEGWGILADDLLAGVYAGALLLMAFLWYNNCFY